MIAAAFGLSRRDCIRLLLSSAACRLFATPTLGTVTPVERLLREHGAEPVRTAQKNYRAHAYVHLLAIPIFSRQDVGAGYAIASAGGDENQSVLNLEFAGGSHPDRTRGLNRVGYIQEAIVERSGSPAESAYYGFMVSSGEKNLEQARGSLQTDTTGSIPYSAAVGSGRPGKFDCAVSHMPVPARYNWSCFEQLRAAMRSMVLAASDTKRWQVMLDQGAGAPNTFLYSMHRAILAKETKLRVPIVYNGKRFELSTEKQPDQKAGQQLVTRKATLHPERTWRLSGSISESATRQTSNFQVWFEQGDPSGLPIRIEFYPKSFLKLIFEQELSEPVSSRAAAAL